MTLWSILALVALVWLVLGVLAAWVLVRLWRDNDDDDDEDPPGTFSRNGAVRWRSGQ